MLLMPSQKVCLYIRELEEIPRMGKGCGQSYVNVLKSLLIVYSRASFAKVMALYSISSIIFASNSFMYFK